MTHFLKLCTACEMFIMTRTYKQMDRIVTALQDGTLSEHIKVERYPLCPSCEPKYVAWANSIHEKVMGKS